MTFGEKVRSLRKEKKMSQQELASMVGVSYRTFMDEIQSLYLDSKRRAKKFTPKKYLKNQEEK